MYAVDGPRVIAPEKDFDNQRKSVDLPILHERDLKKLVEQQVKDELAQAREGTFIPKGIPYLEELDTIQYPKAFVLPSLKIFYSSGEPHAMLNTLQSQLLQY